MAEKNETKYTYVPPYHTHTNHLKSCGSYGYAGTMKHSTLIENLICTEGHILSIRRCMHFRILTSLILGCFLAITTS